jgi:hypothetical protein
MQRIYKYKVKGLTFEEHLFFGRQKAVLMHVLVLSVGPFRVMLND